MPPEETACAPLVPQPGVRVTPRAEAGAEAAAGASAEAAAVAAPGAGNAPSPRRSPRQVPRPPLNGEGLDAEQEVVEAPPQLGRVHLRSLAQLRSSEVDNLAAQLRAVEMPTGPFATDELAKAEINAWAGDRGTAGGGFGVFWSSLKPAVLSGRGSRGILHRLACHNNSLKHGKCTWSLVLEECQEGWAIRSFHPHDGAESGHNHPLIQTAVEARARSSMREIPRELVDIGKALVLSGVQPNQVFRFLKEQAEKDGAEALFTYQDVYHACGASTGERRLDATNLVEMLNKREMEEGLFQRTTTDESGCLKEVFFVMEGATEVYANAPEKQVVEIDHKVSLRRLRSLKTALANILFMTDAARHQQARA
jgi:hypothetical protein